MDTADINEVLKFDPFQAAEDLTGTSYKSSKETEDLGFALFMVHASRKNAMLKTLGDSKLINELEDYKDIIGSIGFELAASFPFKGPSWKDEPAVDETQFVYGHRKFGIILTFDTYNGTSVNGGQFHYCWKPTPGNDCIYRVTSSGGFESESRVKWRHEPEFNDKNPDDLYWSGSHDCREAINFHIQQLVDNGTFFQKWPEASQGQNKSGFYLMSYSDWKHPDYKCGSSSGDSYLYKVFTAKYSALPEWCKEIIGAPEKHEHNKPYL